MAKTTNPVVFVVDDDQAVRRFLCGLIASVNLEVKAYSSARDFLDALEPGRSGCILLDVRMPGISGLELQQELVERAIDLPVIILTGHGNVQVAVHAMKAGAVDFIEKPFNNELLLDRIQKAVLESITACGIRDELDEIRLRFDALTPRERQVLDMVVVGETNKSIARHFKISGKTVENHRARVMEKMQAKSLAVLVRMISDLEHL